MEKFELYEKRKGDAVFHYLNEATEVHFNDCKVTFFSQHDVIMLREYCLKDTSGQILNLEIMTVSLSAPYKVVAVASRGHTLDPEQK
jgi:hypothetical protein